MKHFLWMWQLSVQKWSSAWVCSFSLSFLMFRGDRLCDSLILWKIIMCWNMRQNLKVNKRPTFRNFLVVSLELNLFIFSNRLVELSKRISIQRKFIESVEICHCFMIIIDYKIAHCLSRSRLYLWLILLFFLIKSDHVSANFKIESQKINRHIYFLNLFCFFLSLFR